MSSTFWFSPFVRVNVDLNFFRYIFHLISPNVCILRNFRTPLSDFSWAFKQRNRDYKKLRIFTTSYTITGDIPIASSSKKAAEIVNIRNSSAMHK